MVADHEGLAAPALLALVRTLVGVRPDVLLQVRPGQCEVDNELLTPIEDQNLKCQM